MPIFEIVNPADHYTIIGEPLICSAAVLLIGSGAYALRGVTPEEDPFGGVAFRGEDALKIAIDKHCNGDGPAWIDAHEAEICAALDTVLIGDRAEHDVARSELPEGTDLAAWEAEWHDKHRSSMNDIGAEARGVAHRLRTTPAGDEEGEFGGNMYPPADDEDEY